MDKMTIIEKLCNNEVENILDFIMEYRTQNPYDVDMMTVEAYVRLQNKESNKTIELLNFARKVNPFDADVYYVLSEAYLEEGKYYEALFNMYRAYVLNSYYRDEYLFSSKEICSQRIDDMEQAVVNGITLMNKGQIDYLLNMINHKFWMLCDMIRSDDNIIGDYFFFSPEDKRYCGFHNPVMNLEYENENIITLRRVKGEILKVYGEGCDYSFDFNSDYLIPVASEKNNNVLSIEQNDDIYYTVQRFPKAFNYYRLSGKTRIISKDPMIVGEPIKLNYNPEKKRIVISLFIDGLAQKIIDEVGLEKLMPNTYKFFSKGVRFKNAFTTSDWTYPSLASYITGLDASQHMMIKPKLTVGIPDDAKLIFEYMKEAGYLTTMVTGDWRSSVSDGYGRGLDRYVAQHQNYGNRTEAAMIEAVNQIEAFNETNHYIWIETGDLHDIADGFELPLAVQTHMKASARKYEKIGETSVKQDYSPQKHDAYIMYAQNLDKYFKILYDYLEENYADDEYVVTVFGDHGQRYFTKPGEFHLSRSHTNVGFMTRGGGFTGECDEFVSAVDYPKILCKLADINPDIVSNGNLPVALGGKRENEMVLTEDLHEGDKYMAVIRNRQHSFYFETEAPVDDYGHIEYENHKAWLEDAKGQPIEDEAALNGYLEYLKEHIKYLRKY